MVSQSFVRAFQSIFRKSLDSREKNEYEDISSDVSLTGNSKKNKSQLCEREETSECNSHQSYLSNIQPRISIVKKCENQEKNEASTPNEITRSNIEKQGISKHYNHSKKGLKDKEKMRSVSPASTTEESQSKENDESSGSSVIPDSQNTANISPVISAFSAETDCKDSESSSGSECSFSSSPKGIYDLCESEPKFYDQKGGKRAKRGENEKKSGDESKNVESRDQTGASAKQERSNSRKKKTIDEELGTVILNKISTSKKKVSNENKKTCKTKNEESPQKSDMLIRLRLPLSGSNRKKLFAVKLSKLISLVSNKRHPLNKWAGKLSVENLNLLNDSEFKILLKILSHFVRVKIVRR